MADSPASIPLDASPGSMLLNIAPGLTRFNVPSAFWRGT